MEEVLQNYPVLTGVIVALVTLVEIIRRRINSKKKNASTYGIIQLEIEATKLHYQKEEEQWKSVSEKSEILYSKYLEVYCKNLQLNPGDYRAKIYNSFILDQVRKTTDIIMKNAIEVNNFTSREGDAWVKYKSDKMEYILIEAIKRITELWDEDVLQYKQDYVIGKCRAEIVEIYKDSIFPMLDDIKEIAKKYEKKIDDVKEMIEGIKKTAAINFNLKGD